MKGMSKCRCKNPVNLKDKQEGCTKSKNKECCGNTKDHSCKSTKNKYSTARSKDKPELKYNPNRNA